MSFNTKMGEVLLSLLVSAMERDPWFEESLHEKVKGFPISVQEGEIETAEKSAGQSYLKVMLEAKHGEDPVHINIGIFEVETVDNTRFTVTLNESRDGNPYHETVTENSDAEKAAADLYEACKKLATRYTFYLRGLYQLG